MGWDEAEDVFEKAKSVAGMVSFFSLIGSAIQHGRSSLAYDALVLVGLKRNRAWFIVDSWEKIIARESTTGWTPEATAMWFVIAEVEGWRDVPWRQLMRRLAVVNEV
jgi:hypothetical protein